MYVSKSSTACLLNCYKNYELLYVYKLIFWAICYLLKDVNNRLALVE